MRKEEEAIDHARMMAQLAAMRVANNRRNLAATVLNAAEMSVMRTLCARAIPDGEVAYWKLVEDEVGK